MKYHDRDAIRKALIAKTGKEPRWADIMTLHSVCKKNDLHPLRMIDKWDNKKYNLYAFVRGLLRDYPGTYRDEGCTWWKFVEELPVTPDTEFADQIAKLRNQVEL